MCEFTCGCLHAVSLLRLVRVVRTLLERTVRVEATLLHVEATHFLLVRRELISVEPITDRLLVAVLNQPFFLDRIVLRIRTDLGLLRDGPELLVLPRLVVRRGGEAPM